MIAKRMPAALSYFPWWLVIFIKDGRHIKPGGDISCIPGSAFRN
jgi:hypothetical protein